MTWYRKIRKWLIRHMKWTLAGAFLLTAAGLYMVGSLTFGGRVSLAAGSIQEGIAEEIIRFHVIANSDTQEDQALKIRVKDQVVEGLKPLLAEAADVKESREILKSHLQEIRQMAEEVIQKEGYSYQVEAELTHCYFPMKSYGDCTFPAGNYEALRITIGEAQGKNWWCVLFPNLCFVDSIHGVVPEEQKKELQYVLTEEEYDSLFSWKEKEVRVGFRWF